MTGALPPPKLVHKVVIGDSRHMAEVADGSVHLVVTSPPYWQLKDYGPQNQIGFNSTYAEYVGALERVWQECYRVLVPGCRLCVNIGDQFARSVFYGRYKVLPIREDIIRACEAIGFDYMGAIIWQKKTTMNTSGGAVVMGSYPYPRNGIVEIDYEFILLFKKLGNAPRVSREVKEASRLTREEWKEYFTGHWYFGGERQNGHVAMFPEELPRRLIKMFSFVGDTILDPFLGSGTTTLAAHRLGRSSIGYDINPDFLPVIQEKLRPVLDDVRNMFMGQTVSVEFLEQRDEVPQRVDPLPPITTVSQPAPRIDPRSIKFGSVVSVGDKAGEGLNTVREILDVDRVRLDTGLVIRLLGVEPWDDQNVRTAALAYLERYVRGKKVILRFDSIQQDDSGVLQAYVYLKNRIFINAELIKAGLARPSSLPELRYAQTFRRCLEQARRNGTGIWAGESEAAVAGKSS